MTPASSMSTGLQYLGMVNLLIFVCAHIHYIINNAFTTVQVKWNQLFYVSIAIEIKNIFGKNVVTALVNTRRIALETNIYRIVAPIAVNK